MLRSFCLSALPLLATLLLAGCDNVGRAFDPTVGPTNPTNPTGPVNIQVPPATGDFRTGRPTVKATYPKATGWPTTVPIVVEFSESMNTGSIAPTSLTANDGKVILRLKGTTQALPAVYDFLAGGRLLILRPTAPLQSTNTSAYEVVILPGVRDSDGEQYQVTTEEILAEFTPNAPSTENDGKILAIYPRDTVRDVPRNTQYIAVFTRAANPATVTAQSFKVSDGSANVVAGTISQPLSSLNVADARIFQFDAASLYSASLSYQLSVTNAITFGTNGGVLDYGNRTPIARFTTAPIQAPTAVTVGTITTGFPDKINRNTLATVGVDVVVPADAAAGDKVVARIYGGDKATSATNDIAFVERTFTLAVSGGQTARVDFSGQLGTLTRPKFDDGSILLVAQIFRGTIHSGVLLGGSTARFDVTPPTVQSFGPPGPATGTDIYTEMEHLALYGTASEAISAAELVVPPNNAVGLFAGANDGTFQMLPVNLGPRSTVATYSLNVTDLAGNLSAAPSAGNILQRGVYTGTVAGGMDVNVYDAVTLRPISGATVVVEPQVPTVPATGQQTAITNTDGNCAFTAGLAATNTITAVAPGYGLATLYNSAASFASLPLQPIATSSASVRGTLTAQFGPNVRAIIGCNVFDEEGLLSVSSSASSPSTIPTTPIRANRPQVITALAGTFEPTAVPTFSSVGCNLLGTSLTTQTVPGAPVAPNAEAVRNLTLVPMTGVLVGNMATLLQEDFTLATGLDTANLQGGKPVVRMMLSLLGFPAQSVFGVGFATLGAGATYTINGSWASALSTQLTALTSASWVMTEARDTAGRISRLRALLDLTSGGSFDGMNPMAIPTVSGPTSSTGAPAINVVDVIDPVSLGGIVGLLEVAVQDTTGRRWTVFVEDRDAAGGSETIQMPRLPAGVSGLANGVWNFRASARTCFPIGSTAGNVVLSETRRMEVGFAQSTTLPITVQ